jgi:hypothetical protein
MIRLREKQHLCECGECISEFIWVVKGVFLCSQRCGQRAADRAAFIRDDTQPVSRAYEGRI